MGHQSYVLLCTKNALSNPPAVILKSSCDVHLSSSPCLMSVTFCLGSWGGLSRRWQDGHRNPVLHHQGCLWYRWLLGLLGEKSNSRCNTWRRYYCRAFKSWCWHPGSWMSKGKEILINFQKKTRQTAAVIRDADITVAHSNRDAGIQEAECQKALFYGNLRHYQKPKSF